MIADLALCPRDGLSLRDSRGLAFAGGGSYERPWPTPTTMAGAARSMVGMGLGLSTVYREDGERWAELAREVSIVGPIAVSRPATGTGGWTPLWPSPRDALRRPGKHGGRAHLQWSRPQRRSKVGARVQALWGGDQAERGATEGLMLAIDDQVDKPLPSRPLWSHLQLMAWLIEPSGRQEEPPPPVPERRLDTRLSIDPATLAARDQHLFAQPTYEMLTRQDARRRQAVHEIGIALRVDTGSRETDLTLRPWRIGGESRFAFPERLEPDVLAAPPELLSRLPSSRLLRLVLVTPARFAAGWRPDWLSPQRHEGGFRFEGSLPAIDKRVALRAAFVDRPQWLSGWDLARQEPKPSVACVAAGAVYYFEALDAAFTADELQKLWLCSIQSPNDPERADGFGRVVPGSWPESG